MCFSKVEAFKGKQNCFKHCLYCICRGSVHCIRMSLILTVRCAVSDAASARRFCITAMQIADVSRPSIVGEYPTLPVTFHFSFVLTRQRSFLKF